MRRNSLTRSCIDYPDYPPSFLCSRVETVRSSQMSTPSETGASNLLSDRCCQFEVDLYSPPQLDHLTSKLSRLDASGGSNKQNKRRPESGGKKGKYMKSISAIICALVLLGSMAAVRAETCCEKAKAAGKDCEH